MSGVTPTPAETGGFHLDWRIARSYAQFAGGFWTGKSARRAWTLTLALAGSLLLSTFVTWVMIQWTGWFIDALTRRDTAVVGRAILLFFPIVAAMAAIGVAIVTTRVTLQVRWRQWLVDRLIATWLDQRKFYHLSASGLEPPNPEYRISDDTRWATEVLVDLGIGLTTAVVGGITFIAVLWTVGGGYRVGGITIPGFMVWCALAYGLSASALTALVGRPLVGRVGQKNEAEGYFRFAMMRLRDNAESIALVDGAGAERHVLRGFYDTVVGRWLAIVRSNAQLTWITNATGPMIPIVPFFFAAPKFLAGDLTYGEVTQLVGAFIQVQQAISWVVDNYGRIADWYASARRVMDIVDASKTIQSRLPLTREGVAPASGVALVLDKVSLADAEGRTLLRPVTLQLERGEAVYMAGAANTGKSTLARVLAGLVVPTSGRLEGLPTRSILLLPQKIYLPLGTLAEVIAYPHTGARPSSAELVDVLDAVGLSALAGRLNETARWDQVLSTGERQRLAAARVLITRPHVLVIDDALSALDGAAQKILIRRLRDEIPDLTILGLGQRAAPADVFDRTLHLTRLDHAALQGETVS